MYSDGQIIDKKEHIEFANWVNAQGGGFYTISNGDGTYTIHKTPEITPEELQIRVREIRDNALEQTDKYMIADFPITDEEREQYKAYRQYLRDYTKQNNWWENLPDNFADWRANIAKVDETLKESTKTETRI